MLRSLFFRINRPLRILLIICASVFVLFIAFKIVSGIAYSSVFNGDGDVWNVFLVGADNNNTDGMDKLGNADGQIIVSVRKDRHDIVLTSILRDSFFKLDNQAIGNKGTLLYHYYGLDTLMEALESNLGIHFDNYAVISYPALINAVDALGGIEMELSKEEIIEMNAKLIQINTELFGLDKYDGALFVDYDTYEGTHRFTLTGKQAACLARVRLSDATNNDFGRTERERKILLEIKKKFMKAGLFKKAAVLKQVLAEIDTDISGTQFAAILVNAINLSHYRIVSQRIPLDDTYYGENGYIYMDINKNREFLLDSIYS